MSLAGSDVGKGVLDRDARTEGGAALWGGLELPIFALGGFVLGDRDAATSPAGGLRTTRAKRTRSANLWVEVDRAAGLEWLYLARWARDGSCAQIDVKSALENRPGRAGRCAQGLANTVPPLARVAVTRGLLTYARSTCASARVKP